MTVRASRDPWIPFHRPAPGAKLRLFCFPFAGGGASVYSGWPKQLPSSVEVCAVQLPGRENRISESPYRTMPSLIDDLLPALSPYFDLPFAFFGYSMGAGVSHALAHRLHRRGGPEPSHLIVAARIAPQLQMELIHDLPLDQLRIKMDEFNGTPSEVFEHPELLELILPILRADFELNGVYLWDGSAPLSCGVSAFGGRLDPKVDHEGLRGWGSSTTGSFRVKVFEGDHFFMRHCSDELMIEIVKDLQAHGLSPV